MEQNNANAKSVHESVKRTRWWFVACLSLPGLLIAFALLIPRQPEPTTDPGPVFNGKTVTDWINSIQIGNESDAAITNLIEIGKQAIPYLTKAVEWKPSFRDKFSRVLSAHGRGLWAYRLGLTDSESLRQKHISKKGAMVVLRVIGPPATEALPALRRVARDKDWGSRAFALSAIVNIGPEQRDTPMFVRALKDDQWIVRIQGARGLGKIEKPAPKSIEALKGAILDKNERVRKSAYDALQKIDPYAARDLSSSQSK